MKDKSETGSRHITYLGVPVRCGTFVAGSQSMDGESHNEYWSMTQLSLDLLSPAPMGTYGSDYVVHLRVDLQPQITPCCGAKAVEQLVARPRAAVVYFSYAAERKQKSERLSALQRVLEHARSLSW